MFPVIGSLYLSRAGLGIIPAGTYDGNGHAFTTLMLPGTLGSSCYLQGYSSNPRRLGNDWVKITTVP